MIKNVRKARLNLKGIKFVYAMKQILSAIAIIIIVLLTAWIFDLKGTTTKHEDISFRNAVNLVLNANCN